MTSCEPQTYTGITPEMLQALSESARSAFGLDLDGDEGVTSAMGTTLAWKYDKATHSLTITCTSKPMFLSCADIYGQVGKMLDRRR